MFLTLLHMWLTCMLTVISDLAENTMKFLDTGVKLYYFFYSLIFHRLYCHLEYKFLFLPIPNLIFSCSEVHISILGRILALLLPI